MSTSLLVSLILFIQSVIFQGHVDAFPEWYYMDDESSDVITLTTNNPDGVLYTSFALTYSNNDNCTKTIKSPKGTKILFIFISFEVESNSDSTCTDELSIWDGDLTSGGWLTPTNGLCGTLLDVPDQGYASSTNETTLYWNSDSSGNSYGFIINFNIYTATPCDATTEFACQNNRCIPLELENNLHDNCGDLSDEPDVLSFIAKVLAMGIGILVGVIVAIVVCCICCVVGCVCCCMKCKK